MRAVVDPERCQGHALCASFAPDVYVLDEVGYNRTESTDIPGRLRDQALRGAAACPERAITLVDGADQPTGQPGKGSR
jgi:ferredoxin